MRKPVYATNAPLRADTRIWELDFLRGVCVLLMVFDHVMYDIGDLFSSAWKGTGSEFLIDLCDKAYQYYFHSPVRAVVQPLVVIIFCVLCGISCSFSHSNLKRGVQVAFGAMCVTAVTFAIEVPIRFGILHMFTFAILTWWLIDTICRHRRYVTAIACFVVGLTIVIVNAVLMKQYNLDNHAFATDNEWAWLGQFLYGDTWDYNYSADYQPVFPLVGYMLLGASAAPLLYPRRRSLLPWLGKYDWYRPFSMWGRIALPVYLVHQVAVAAILALISFLWITPGNFVII